MQTIATESVQNKMNRRSLSMDDLDEETTFSGRNLNVDITRAKKNALPKYLILEIEYAEENEQYTFLVDRDVTTLDVKKLVRDKTGIPPQEQELKFIGVILKDGQRVVHFEQQSKTVLSLRRTTDEMIVGRPVPKVTYETQMRKLRELRRK